MHQPSLSVENNSTVSFLYQRHALLIMIAVRRLVPSWEDAEDIVLEVFVAALKQEKLLTGSLRLMSDTNVLHIIGNGYWDTTDLPHPIHEKGLPALSTTTTTSSNVELDSTLQIEPFNTLGTFHLYDTLHPGATLIITVTLAGTPATTPSPIPTGAVSVSLVTQNFQPARVMLHKGSRLLLTNANRAIYHLIANGRWQNNQFVPVSEPGMPRIELAFQPEMPAQLVGPFNTPGTYYLADRIHPNMTLTIVVQQTS